METLLSIFAEIDDPRDHTAQYLLSSMLFIALAATLCGAKACTEIADYAEANLAELSEIVDLPGRTPTITGIRTANGRRGSANEMDVDHTNRAHALDQLGAGDQCGAERHAARTSCRRGI